MFEVYNDMDIDRLHEISKRDLFRIFSPEDLVKEINKSINHVDIDRNLLLSMDHFSQTVVTLWKEHDYNWQFDTVKFIYCLLNELKPRTKTELNAIISSVIMMRCTNFTIEMYADAIHGRSVSGYSIFVKGKSEKLGNDIEKALTKAGIVAENITKIKGIYDNN